MDLNRCKPEPVFDYPGFYMRLAGVCDYRTYVELGAYMGDSTIFLARELLHCMQSFSLFAVDLWADQPHNSKWGKQQAQRFEGEFGEEGMYRAYWDRVCRAGVRKHIQDIRMCSWEAANLFSDGAVDVVFVDANHDYYAVRRDLEAWRPKVRAGGILAGHEWRHATVKRAVAEVLCDREIEDVQTDKNFGVWSCRL